MIAQFSSSTTLLLMRMASLYSGISVLSSSTCPCFSKNWIIKFNWNFIFSSCSLKWQETTKIFSDFNGIIWILPWFWKCFYLLLVSSIFMLALLFDSLSPMCTQSGYRICNLFPYMKFSATGFSLTHCSRCSERKYPCWREILVNEKQMEKSPSQHPFSCSVYSRVCSWMTMNVKIM